MSGRLTAPSVNLFVNHPFFSSVFIRAIRATHKVLGERKNEGYPLVLPRDLLRYPENHHICIGHATRV